MWKLVEPSRDSEKKEAEKQSIPYLINLIIEKYLKHKEREYNKEKGILTPVISCISNYKIKYIK